jgi:hypothetical protein
LNLRGETVNGTADVLRFHITFHSPFRVGAAGARDGIDLTVDVGDPLPATHLKGVTRAAARDILGVPASLLGEIFGTTATPSPWAWSAAVPTAPWKPNTVHRVNIDPQTHAAAKDMLVHAEQCWAPAARFSITRTGAAVAATPTHRAVLRCATAAVHNLGGCRRRGLGWVGITPEPAVSPQDVADVRAAVR